LWYYFKGKKLKGGPYKNAVRGRLLFYRPGINISDEVHTGITAKPGYGLAEIPFKGLNYDEHYWCNSWAQLKDKHTRYSKGEGKVLYLEGKRFTWFMLIYQAIKRFFTAFLKQEYYKDGFKGMRFSFYEARYTFLSWHSLQKYQQELKSKGAFKSQAEVAQEQMQKKAEDFIKVTQEIKQDYEKEIDQLLKEQIMQQYQKSLHRLVNDMLEINAFELVKKVLSIASFNEEMTYYISTTLLLDRLKLIQESGSYNLKIKLKKILN